MILRKSSGEQIVQHNIPSGKRLQKTMKNHHVQWEYPLFLWPFSIVFCKRLPEGLATVRSTNKETHDLSPIFHHFHTIFPAFFHHSPMKFPDFWHWRPSRNMSARLAGGRWNSERNHSALCIARSSACLKIAIQDLVGGAITILKNMSSSMGRMTSHI
jgi:hypothetical protein